MQPSKLAEQMVVLCPIRQIDYCWIQAVRQNEAEEWVTKREDKRRRVMVI